MALEVKTLRTEKAGGALIADRRLCLAADQVTVVEAGDPRAAFLLCGEGSEITGAEAQRLRLSMVGACVVQDAPTEVTAEEKEAPKPEDKQAARPEENKQATKPARSKGSSGRGV